MSLKYLNELKSHLDNIGLEQTNISNACNSTKLIEYLLLLEKWNKIYNLTSIRKLDEMFIKHLLDSLVVAPLITGKKLIDVGSGGGLPGVVLAILFPEKQIDLLDSNSKKTRFLIQTKAELGLKNITVIHKRVEEYQPDILYDGVVSRAFSSLNEMLSLTKHLLTKDGNWWAMKAQKAQVELTHLPNSVMLINNFELSVPGLDAKRTLIQLQRAF